MAAEVLHPYLGFVVDFQNNYAAHGFVADWSPFEPDPDAVSVLLTGGSVARGNAQFLQRELERSAEQRGLDLRFRVFPAALGGYKQPQQLMALSYLAALGAKFDLIVNLDGFNDIVLPIVENFPRGVATYFPRLWDVRFLRFVDPNASRIHEEAQMQRRREHEVLDFARKSPIGFSSLYGLYASLRLQHLERRIADLSKELESAKLSKDFERTGYVPEDLTIVEAFQRSADLWARASVLIGVIAKGTGARYVHVLQPNQYVAGSKPISEREKKEAFNEKRPYAIAVRKGYPLLYERIPKIKEQVGLFIDATMVFANNVEDIYIDKCCHVNEEGNTLLARLIAEKILAQFF